MTTTAVTTVAAIAAAVATVTMTRAGAVKINAAGSVIRAVTPRRRSSAGAIAIVDSRYGRRAAGTASSEFRRPQGGCRHTPSNPNGDVSFWLAGGVVSRLTVRPCGIAYRLAMTLVVLRKSVDDERVGGPYSCADPQEIARIVGRLTLEERLAHLLNADEVVKVTEEGQIKVFRDEDLVGYIVVLTGE